MYPSLPMIWMAMWWTVCLAVIALVLWLLLSTFRSSSGRDESPEEILQRRFAAGEIDAAEYQRRLEVLSKTKRAA